MACAEGVSYSYNCNNCKFKDFMQKFGVTIKSDNCWIDCTNEIKEELDCVFDEINGYMHMNGAGLVLFDGIPSEDYHDFLEERGLTSQVNKDISMSYVEKWKSIGELL